MEDSPARKLSTHFAPAARVGIGNVLEMCIQQALLMLLVPAAARSFNRSVNSVLCFNRPEMQEGNRPKFSYCESTWPRRVLRHKRFRRKR